MAIWRTVSVIESPSLGGTGTNTHHFRTTTGEISVAETQLQEFTNHLHLFYVAIIGRLAVNTIVSNEGIYVRVDDDSGDLIDTTGDATAPSSGSFPMPPQDCLTVTWRTSHAGRSGRGRTFLGPLSVSCLQNNGTPDETARTEIGAAAFALYNHFAGGGDGAPCVWSLHDGVGRDIIGADTHNEFASLRSRRD